MSIGSLLLLSAFTLFAKARGGDVEALTSKTFDGVIANADLVLVKFFAPWCGHCQAMEKDFEKAATKLKGTAVLADVDATKEEKLAQKYNVEGFPTIKLFSKGLEIANYNGERDVKSMISFVKSATKPAFETFDTKAQLDSLLAKNKGSHVLIGAGLGDEGRAAFTKASFALRDFFPESLAFVAVKNPAVAKHVMPLSAGEFGLLRYEDGERAPIAYTDSNLDNLAAFVKNQAMSFFAEFSQETAELYTEDSTPLVIAFTRASSPDTDPILKTVKAVAKQYATNKDIRFAWVDANKLEGFIEYAGLVDSDIPVFAYGMEDDQKYHLPTSLTDLTEENLSAWVDDVLGGRVEAALKSQPIPESQPESGATVVVGDSWRSIVEDPEKDVLVAQVAPWCGHCRAMKPAFNRVADELKAAGVDTVRVAIMDATENDAPNEYKAKGFPTIQFFAAGKKQKGIEYDGERTSSELIEMLKQKATVKFQFDTSKLGKDPEPEDDEESEEDSGEGLDENADYEEAEEEEHEEREEGNGADGAQDEDEDMVEEVTDFPSDENDEKEITEGGLGELEGSELSGAAEDVQYVDDDFIEKLETKFRATGASDDEVEKMMDDHFSQMSDSKSEHLSGDDDMDDNMDEDGEDDGMVQGDENEGDANENGGEIHGEAAEPEDYSEDEKDEL